MKRVLATVALALPMAALLSGCLFKTADELYTLPELSEDYANLQDEIEALINTGLEYAAPRSGDNTQAVQFQDLDGDGQNEALAFFRDENNSDGKALLIQIYRKTENGLYQAAAQLRGEGSAFHSVEYGELNGSGSLELVVNCQISDQVYALSVYSLDSDSPDLLLQSGCSSYGVADLDEDGVSEVVLFQQDSTGAEGARAEWYVSDGGVLSLAGTAALSPIQIITRTRSSKLAEGEPAVFLTGTYGASGDQLVTDILALREGVFTNLTLSETEGYSAVTLRADTGDEIFSTDINGDGVYEIPVATELTELGDSGLWQVDWLQYHLDGTADRVCTTLCAPEDGSDWYLELPDSFWDRFSDSLGVMRSESASHEETAITLYDCAAPGAGEEDSGSYTALCSIYLITGANRQSRAQLTGRYTLYETRDTVYAFSLETASGLTQTQIQEGFHFMPTSWAD